MQELRAWIKELGFPAAIAGYLLYLTSTTIAQLQTSIAQQVGATAALAVVVHDLRESLDYHYGLQAPSSPPTPSAGSRAVVPRGLP